MNKNKGIVVLITVLLTFCSVFFGSSHYQAAYADAGNLEIRIGYFGDVGDYRVKANFTRSELEALGTAEYRYSNITSFGTVMEIVARGVTVTEILSAAGIDPGSVETLNFRTTDGTQVNNWFVSLSMGKWVYGNRYYYPNLRGNYQTQEQQVLPGEGALSGAISVPSILAIESCETKSPTAVIDGTMMDTESSYRFCAGQGPLSEGIPSSDVTSNNSAQWIYGIDVTLRGSPGEATGVSLKIDDPNVKVGSQKKITAIIQGHELFEDKVNGTLTWSSSDESIATVDGEGNVTVHKEGAVTITATTENGISRSVTINGVGQMPGDKESIKDSGGESGAMGVALSQGEPRDIEAQDSKEKRNANLKGKTVKGINLVKAGQEEMAEDVVALPPETADEHAPVYMLAVGLFCLTLGMVLRIFRYKREV